MMLTGKAMVWTDKNELKLTELPIPEVKKDSLLIKNEVAGVCGTDGHLIQEKPPYPAMLCHEIVGRVFQMGSEVHNSINVFGGPLKIGDRITIYPWITCGKCRGCLTYRPGTCTTCDNSFVYGIPYPKLGLSGKETLSSNVNEFPYFKGGFAEYTYIFPNTYVWRVPDDMPNDVAALLDPLAVAVRSIELAQTCPGMLEEAFSTTSTVVVVGSGPVGVLTCLLARIMGVEKIILIGSRQKRLDIAKKIAHVDFTFDYHELQNFEVIETVKELTHGGADVIFQCANHPEAFIDALEMVRRLGSVIEVGNMVNIGTKIPIDIARLICSKHARIIGMSANHPGSYNKAFHLLMRYKDIPFSEIFTHRSNIEGVFELLKKMHDEDYMKGIMVL